MVGEREPCNASRPILTCRAVPCRAVPYRPVPCHIALISGVSPFLLLEGVFRRPWTNRSMPRRPISLLRFIRLDRRDRQRFIRGTRTGRLKAMMTRG